MIDEWLKQVWGDKYPKVAAAIAKYPPSGFYESHAVKAERTLNIIRYLNSQN